MKSKKIGLRWFSISDNNPRGLRKVYEWSNVLGQGRQNCNDNELVLTNPENVIGIGEDVLLSMKVGGQACDPSTYPYSS